MAAVCFSSPNTSSNACTDPCSDSCSNNRSNTCCPDAYSSGRATHVLANDTPNFSCPYEHAVTGTNKRPNFAGTNEHTNVSTYLGPIDSTTVY